MTRLSYLLLLVIIFFQPCNGQKRDQSLYRVQQTTMHLKDTARNRRLTTEVWYPHGKLSTTQAITDGYSSSVNFRKLPLILFSHGTGGGRLTLEWFCKGLAKHGFIVAAVDHFGNTYDNPIPEEFVKIWERPKDLTFILDEILRDKRFSGIIDTFKVGAAGFSLGGFTVTALAGAQPDIASLISYLKTKHGKVEGNIPEMPSVVSLLVKPEILSQYKVNDTLWDKRIKSVVAMGPALGQAFPTKDSFNNVKIPFLIFAAGGDKIAPYRSNAGYYAQSIPDAELKIISKEAGHYVFLNDVNEEMKRENPIYFTDPDIVDRSRIHHQVIRRTVDFFENTLQL